MGSGRKAQAHLDKIQALPPVTDGFKNQITPITLALQGQGEGDRKLPLLSDSLNHCP